MTTPQTPEALAAKLKRLADDLQARSRDTSNHKTVDALWEGIDKLAALVPTWKPISEIPAAGRFLVYMPEESHTPIQVAKWHPNVKVIGNVFSFDCKPVTNFMELPPEPSHVAAQAEPSPAPMTPEKRRWLLGQRPSAEEVEQFWEHVRSHKTQPEPSPVAAPYGFCPQCGAPGVSRERSPNGKTRCQSGHVYPSRDAVANQQLTTTPVRVPLSEEQLVKCLVEAGCFGKVTMSFDSGPYEITRPSINADRFARAIERAHGITGSAA